MPSTIARRWDANDKDMHHADPAVHNRNGMHCNGPDGGYPTYAESLAYRHMVMARCPNACKHPG